MTRPAEALASAVLALVRDVAPANTATPRWVSLAAEATRRGYTTTAFRRWCERHSVPIREGSHRDAWVSPAEVDRAVEGLPLATTAPDSPERTELCRLGLLPRPP